MSSGPALADTAIDEALASRNLSRLGQVALSLAGEPVRATAFARAALAEMVLALTTETEIARLQLQSSQLQPSQQQGGLMRWVLSVERYIDELQRLAASVDGGAAVAVFAGRDRGLFLLVSGQSIMLSAPRMELQPSFEQNIVDRFCSEYPCHTLTSPATLSAASHGSTSTPPRWSFSEGAGPSCETDDGLVLQFASAAGLRRKRQFCLQLVAELRAIAAAIGREQGRGVQPDWERMAIHAMPADDKYQLDLNARGDSVQLAIPVCAAAPAIVRQAQPWLLARADNRRYTLILENTERLLPATP